MLDFSVTFLITIVNITLLYFVLRLILFKPVTKFMADRAQRVQNDFDRAAADREKSEELRARYEEKLETVEAEADRIRSEARVSATAQAEAIIERAKADAALLIENARAQIAAERAASALRFKAEAAALVVHATSRLLGRETTTEDARRSASEFIAETELA